MSTQQQKKPKPGSRAEMREIRRTYNWVNMVIALAACMIVVLFAVMMAPKPDTASERTVDVGQAAQQSSGLPFKLFVPELPSGWHANDAGVSQMGSPTLDTWYVSMLGPDDQWVSIRQAKGDERWVKSQAENMAPIGEDRIGGVTFTRYETPNQKQILTGTVAKSTLVFLGTADWTSFTDFAQQAVEQTKK
ncbi:DUF4245 domain-containing protein [Brevibacterium sp. 91QC2O2]|uniref:DUF4245 domain-containing protein n=1 Tax=Brevibacterium sp. 91QC2O2 TaxID=2968458 RepID=UPI00211C5C09|nr:DUF4245 domain-containing protein [Brevibacterium sp. 91QC2O2]